MKIENPDGNQRIHPPASRMQGAGERRDAGVPEPSHEAPGDRVELSDTARAIQLARQVLDGLPEVRLEKVAELQAKIEGGLYNVRGEQVAVRMLGQGLLDRLI